MRTRVHTWHVDLYDKLLENEKERFTVTHRTTSNHEQKSIYVMRTRYHSRKLLLKNNIIPVDEINYKQTMARNGKRKWKFCFGVSFLFLFFNIMPMNFECEFSIFHSLLHSHSKFDAKMQQLLKIHKCKFRISLKSRKLVKISTINVSCKHFYGLPTFKEKLNNKRHRGRKKAQFDGISSLYSNFFCTIVAVIN